MVQLIKLTCTNCNAPLEVDANKEFIFCMHCGQKIMVERDNFQDNGFEMEKGRQRYLREKKQLETAIAGVKREMANRNGVTVSEVLIVMFAIFVLLIDLLLFLFFVMDYAATGQILTELIPVLSIFTVIVIGCFSIKYAIKRRRKSKIPEIKQRLDNLIAEYSKYI